MIVIDSGLLAVLAFCVVMLAVAGLMWLSMRDTADQETARRIADDLREEFPPSDIPVRQPERAPGPGRLDKPSGMEVSFQPARPENPAQPTAVMPPPRAPATPSPAAEDGWKGGGCTTPART